MKLHFCHRAWKYADGSKSTTFSPFAEIISNNKTIENKAFLLGFLQDCRSVSWIEAIENNIRDLELGQLDSFSDASEGHFFRANKHEVVVGRQINDRWKDVNQEHWQEMWRLGEFKAILLAWKKFVEIPADPRHEIVVDILTE